MIPAFLIGVALLILFIIFFGRRDPSKEIRLKDSLFQLFFYGFCIAGLLLLIFSGRIHFLWGFVPLLWSIFLKFRTIYDIFSFFQKARQSSSSASSSSQDMTMEEACAILGVGIEVSEEEIELAYKKQIQKNHPDKGGSSYIAQKINQARDLLINYKKSHKSYKG